MGSQCLGYKLKTPQINLEIAIELLSRLHIHEEIIPHKMLELVVKMPRDGVFIHPIIVDADSLVVLDGMHRVAAANYIELRYIPVCLVDYFNPYIKLGSWYRMFDYLGKIEAEDAIREAGLRPVRMGYKETRYMVEAREVVTAIFSKGWCIAALGDAPDIKARYDAVKTIERILERSHKMGYSTDKEALAHIESGKYGAALMTPTAMKAEVVEAALAGRVFAQKTTRHIIPARPMNVNVPIVWLLGKDSIEVVNRRLREHLSIKKLKKLPPGQVIDRLYDEELYVFE